MTDPAPKPSSAPAPAAAGPPAEAVAPAGDALARGLEPGARFRCDQCGNVTRFDVVARERTRRFWHFDLGGDRSVDEEETLERVIESVTCRWCGRDDAVRVEAAPVSEADADAQG